jgi:hypothetical protein
MRQTTLGFSPLALLTLLGAGILGSAPGAANAQNCRLHYGDAFQLISTESLAGHSPAEIKQTVDNLFGPRQEVCSEAGYKFFLTELSTQAATAFRKKGAEQEARLLVTREILNRFPLRVRFTDGKNPDAGMLQIRADLGVLSKEVGVTPQIQAVLDALAKIAPPKTLARALPKDDDSIQVIVPKVPLPAWAIISLYEIRDHAQHNQNGEVINKTNLILEWVGRINAGARPGDLKVGPAPVVIPAGKSVAATGK